MAVKCTPQSVLDEMVIAMTITVGNLLSRPKLDCDGGYCRCFTTDSLPRGYLG
jgi:hypothetical protein